MITMPLARQGDRSFVWSACYYTEALVLPRHESQVRRPWVAAQRSPTLSTACRGRKTTARALKQSAYRLSKVGRQDGTIRAGRKPDLPKQHQMTVAGYQLLTSDASLRQFCPRYYVPAIDFVVSSKLYQV